MVSPRNWLTMTNWGTPFITLLQIHSILQLLPLRGLIIIPLVKVVADTIYLKWNAVANADGYQIKITKLDTITKVVTQLKYIQPFTDSSTPKKAKLYFSLPRSYFSLLLNNTETYSVQLDALLFENSTSTYLQAIGTASRNIKF